MQRQRGRMNMIWEVKKTKQGQEEEPSGVTLPSSQHWDPRVLHCSMNHNQCWLCVAIVLKPYEVKVYDHLHHLHHQLTFLQHLLHELMMPFDLRMRAVQPSFLLLVIVLRSSFLSPPRPLQLRPLDGSISNQICLFFFPQYFPCCLLSHNDCSVMK